MLKILLPLALLATGLQASPLLAQSAPTARIAHGDLNLASAAGVKALDRRIARAIDQVCEPQAGYAAIYLDRAEDECRTVQQAQIQPRRDAAIARAQQRAAVFASTAR